MGAIGETVIRRVRSFLKCGDHQWQDPGSRVEKNSTKLHLPGTFFLLVRDGGFRALIAWAGKMFSDGGRFRPRQALLSLKAEILWSHVDHEGVRKIASHLAEECKSTLGYYYLAQSSFVHGEFAEAIKWLNGLLGLKPDHADGIYLLSACCLEMGEKERSWSLLEERALRFPRVKTWQLLANHVDSVADFDRLLACHEKAVGLNIIPAFHKDISNHLSLAALRCGDYGRAKSIWRDIILNVISSPVKLAQRRPRPSPYSVGRAERALIDLKAALGAAGIEMFLVSGTLLGCIREGCLLGHDKDIDVGIWDDVSMEQLNAAIRKSGAFFSIPSRSPYIVRVRHLNGIPLDLFYHYRETEDYWHGGVKLKWHNSPFGLSERRFLDETFLIPSNHEVYLEENYGDWKTPVTTFDSAFDTPNGEVIQPDELLIHTCRMLLSSHQKGAASKVEYYLGKLEGMGELQLTREYREKTGGQARVS